MDTTTTTWTGGGVKVTDIWRDPATGVYSVCFRRDAKPRGKPRESSVELSESGYAVRRFDSDRWELSQCQEALRAYLTLQRLGYFEREDW